MLGLPEFELYEPDSVREAAELLDEHGPDAMPVAGGTDLYPKMKRRQFTPDVLVSLDGLDETRGIGTDDGAVRIGGAEPLSTVAESEPIRSRYPAVAEAAGAVSTPTLRGMGTVAGNLCQDTRCVYYDRDRDWREANDWCMKAPGPEGYSPEGAGEDADVGVPCRVAPGSGRCWAVFAGDVAPALIAHAAEVVLVGRDGDRVVPLRELYRDDGIAHLDKRHDELLTGVRLPADDRFESTYRKFSRRDSFDFADVGVAVAVRSLQDGTIRNARIAATGVASRPMELTEAAERLAGEQPTPELLEEVGETAARGIRPMDNTEVHPAHRKRVASVYTRRALSDLLTDGDGPAGRGDREIER